MTWINTNSSLKKKKQTKLEIKLGNNKSFMYYNTKAWRNLRLSYISDNPLCEECLKKGIATPAEEVHHKHEFMKGKTDDDKWNLLLDPNNLESVCRKCHDEIHRQLVKSNRLSQNVS